MINVYSLIRRSIINNNNNLCYSRYGQNILSTTRNKIINLRNETSKTDNNILDINQKKRVESTTNENLSENVNISFSKREQLDDPALPLPQQQQHHLTPAMTQYHHFKAKYPKHILLFRIGDFYEMFYDDAKEVSSLLHITLTSRGIKSSKVDIPMCGFPQHAAESYIEKLIKHGKTVAICDQVEEVKPKSSKSNKIVKRDVVRVITPGTVFEDRFLLHHQNNYLLSIVPNGGKKALSLLSKDTISPSQRFSLSWLDISTGSFNVSATTFDSLAAEIYRISPSEILIPSSISECEEMKSILKSYHISVDEDKSFIIENTKEMFKEAYGVEDLDIEFPQFSNDQLGSIGSILNYIHNTQLGSIPRIDLPQYHSDQSSMFIDHSTRNSLEITKTFQGIRKGSLLDTIDKTITSTGSRLLHSRIQSPSLSISEINQRLNLIEFYFHRPDLIKETRKLLTRCYDLERCLQRVHIKRAGPRDLSSIGSTLASLLQIKSLMETSLNKRDTKTAPQIYRDFKNLVDSISNFDQLLNTLSDALVDNPPFLLSDGGFIQPGFSKELDDILLLQSKSKLFIEQLQTKLRKQLGISTLKIRYNQSIGYYIEVLSVNRDKIPINQIDANSFIHIQTLMNHMRFKSRELIELEEKIKSASSLALEIEIKLFNELCSLISNEYGEQIKLASEILAKIDISCSLALISQERSYTRPILTEKPIINVVGGRHPTVEYAQLTKTGTMRQFVTNDCHLDNEKDSLLWLITGPNMGGKSTFLRQNALISIMAQIGSFVPAERAEIGLMDSIFSRVGSSDDLANDRSTFMVEMIETASILNKATKNSFVIMDEVGRGTSTLDGLAIAQSVVEYLYDKIKCRTLFATHYHELTKLSLGGMPKIKCYALAVKEENDQLLFTHKIMPGVSNKSYGLFCAQLAGIPLPVIKRSKEILNNLEK